MILDAQALADHFAISLRVIHRQTEGLTHTQSLLQLPFRGNCMNWVLGHIALCREEILDTLGQPRALPGVDWSRYDSDTDPITQEGPGILSLEKLLELLDQQALHFTEALLITTPETYAREITVGQNRRTVARRTLFYFFHEANHVGELSLLRQLAGMNDKII